MTKAEAPKYQNYPKPEVTMHSREPLTSPSKVQDILRKFEPKPDGPINNIVSTKNNNNNNNGGDNSAVRNSAVTVQTWTFRRRSEQRPPSAQSRISNGAPQPARVSKVPIPKVPIPKGAPGTHPPPEPSINVSEIAKRFQDPDVKGALPLPTGPPPQKPVRTFAHDIYMSSKQAGPKLNRTQSTLPKKPKLPPKPVRSKTVPTIARAPRVGPSRVAPPRPRTPPPRPPPKHPQPYATAVVDTVFRTRPFVDFKSTVNYRFRNQGILKRSRSEERIYDEPWDARPLRLPLPGGRYGRLDRRKSPSLVLDRADGVVLVDNVLYKGGANNRKGPGALEPPVELHYMSSPIMGHGSPSKLKTTSQFHVQLDEDGSDARPKDVENNPPGTGTKKVNFLDSDDVVDWSFASIYNSAPRWRKSQSQPTKEDDSGDSDNEISEKEIQKRIEHIQRSMSRGPSLRRTVSGQQRTYRKQFDAVLTVGLKYIDGTTVYQPYVKDIFPGPESVPADPNDVAHFCFPDAEAWRPVSMRETYTFVLTDETGFRVFGYCRRVKPEGVEYNIPIVYCVISPILARAYYCQVLSEIEKRHGLSDVKMKAFLQAIQARSVPQPGRTVTIKCSGLDGEQQIAFSRSSDFLMDNGDTYRLLTHLSVSVLLKVFATVLLERRIIFCSSKPEVLTECIHALMALLYPFSWQHTLIPILPAKMLDVVGSPTPYVVGILNSSRPHLEDLVLEEGVIVDLDTSQLIREVGDETTIIPKSIQRALSTALKLIKNRPDLLESPRSILVSQAFMRMFLELIGHYPNHMSLFGDGQRLFHREPFCTALPSHSLQMFLKWFTETQLFDRFIEERTTQNMDSELFEQRIKERETDVDLLKPSRRYNVKDISKKMKNFGEKLIGIKPPSKS